MACFIPAAKFFSGFLAPVSSIFSNFLLAFLALLTMDFPALYFNLAGSLKVSEVSPTFPNEAIPFLKASVKTSGF